MSREQILANIRHALRQGQAPNLAEQEAIQQRLQTHPCSPQLVWESPLVTRFVACAQALSSSTTQVAALTDVPAAMAAYLKSHDLNKNLVGWANLAPLPWEQAGLDYKVRPVTATDWVGVTGCFCAIAETGTLLLLSSPLTPAATSLLPETHLVVVPTSRIVRTMEEAFRLVRAEVGVIPRALNFVSGPSRTADIEQTVTLGAHGPYRVHLVIVETA